MNIKYNYNYYINNINNIIRNLYSFNYKYK